MQYWINLLEKEKKSNNLNWIYVAVSILLVFSTIFNLTKFLELQEWHKNAIPYLEKLNNPKPLKANLSQIESEIADTRKLLSLHRFGWSLFLSRLEKVMPDKVSIKTITPALDGSIDIIGFAANELEPVKLIENLQSASWKLQD